MSDRERIKSLTVRDLIVTGTMTVGGQPSASPTAAPPPIDSPPVTAPAGLRVVGGLVSVTGSGQLASGLAAVSAVSVSLGQPASPSAIAASATATDGSITITVAGGDGTIAAAPVLVNWIALGS